MEPPQQDDLTVVVATQSAQAPITTPPSGQPPQPANAPVASGGSGWSSDAAQKLAFQEYQLLMEGTDKITDRRQTVNTLFVSINALFLTGVGYLLLRFFQDIKNFPWFLLGFFVIAILMSVINRTWLDLSESNRRLVDLRIRYMKQLEKHMRQESYFPVVIVPLKEDETRAPGVQTETTRGTYTLEDVLYNPDAKNQPLGFSRAEQRIGRALTRSYWLALVLAIAGSIILVAFPALGITWQTVLHLIGF